MQINVITFAAHLVNQLTNKIQKRYQESIDDFFNRIRDSHNISINYVKFDNTDLRSSTVKLYADGTIKDTNFWDVLTEPEKEEAKQLAELNDQYKQDSRKLREHFFSVAQRTQEVNEHNEIITYNLIAYAKLFACLPDFILNDTELLTRDHPSFDCLNEQDLEDIRKYTTHLDPKELEQFKQANTSEEINNILSTVYSLELLVDFDL